MKIVKIRKEGNLRITVIGIFEDSSEKELFSYYPDELSFRESELVGLTEEQAKELYHKKDIAYLRR